MTRWATKGHDFPPVVVNLGQLELREVGEQDLKAILALYNDVESFKFATAIEGPTVIGTVELQYHFAQSDPNRCLLAIWFHDPPLTKELIVGFTEALVGHPEDSWATIGVLLVDADWQRRGIGRHAVGLLERYLQESFGVLAYRAGILDHDAAPIAFWEKLGYAVAEVEPRHTFIEGIPRDLIWLTKVRSWQMERA